MKYIILVLLFIVSAYDLNAYAQSVLNPLYEQELAQYEQDLAIKNCPPENGKTHISPIKLITILQTKYPISAETAEEFQLNQLELIRSRITSDGLFDQSDEVVFKKDQNAFRFRRSLLRTFEAAHSGGANGLVVLQSATLASHVRQKVEQSIIKHHFHPEYTKWLDGYYQNELEKLKKANASSEAKIKLAEKFNKKKQSEDTFDKYIAEKLIGTKYGTRVDLLSAALADTKFSRKKFQKNFAKRSTSSLVELPENIYLRKFLFHNETYRPLANPIVDNHVINRYMNDLIKNPTHTDSTRRIIEIHCPKKVHAENKATTLSLSESEIGTFIPANFNNSSSRIITQPVKILSSIAKKRNYKISKDYKTEGNFLLRKNSQELAKSKGEGAKIGFVDGVGSSLLGNTADIALGYKFSSRNYKPSQLTESGKHIQIIPFVSLDQNPIGRTIQNPMIPLLGNGDPNTSTVSENQSIFNVGVRGVLEFVPKGCNPNWVKCQRKRAKELWGQRTPGHTISTEAIYITDDHQDQRGYQVVFGYQPAAPIGLRGFRRKSRLFFIDRAVRGKAEDGLGILNILRSGFLQYDATLVADYTDYSRPPRDNSTISPLDRLLDADSSRWGADLNLDLDWTNIFSILNDDTRFGIGLDYSFRKRFSGSKDDAELIALDFKLKDVSDKRYDFGVSFNKGQNLQTGAELDYTGFNIGLKF